MVYSLSYDKNRGHPIARVEGGDLDGKVVYLYNPDEEKKKDKKQLEEQDKLDYDDIKLLKTCLRLGKDENGKKLKQKEITELKKLLRLNDITGGNELEIKNGKFVMIPEFRLDSNGREICNHFTISAPTGSGKSSWINWYVREKMKIMKKYIVIFSKHEEGTDPSFKDIDDLNPIYIPIDKSLLTTELELKDFSDCIVIFDDIDQIRDEKIRKIVQHFRDDCLENLRHYNGQVLSVSHQIKNGHKTKISLNECPYFVLFPKFGMKGQVESFLKDNLKLDKKNRDRILNLDTRACIIKQTTPQICISDKEIFLLM